MLALALGLSLLVQDPSPSQDPASRPRKSEAPAPAPRVEEWDDREAKEVVKQFEKLTKGRDTSLRDRMAAVELLAKGCSEKLVKPLSKLMLKDESLVVCMRAAELLGDQPGKATKPAIAGLLGAKKFEEEPAVQAELVRSLSRAGYSPGRDWQLLDGVFERDYGAERAGLQKAILQLVTEHREIAAVDLLVDNLGEPTPENPDDPGNPPAEYWEARWKSWEVWRDEVRTALIEVTGQRFSTKQEARAWLSKNRKKLERRQREARRDRR